MVSNKQTKQVSYEERRKCHKLTDWEQFKPKDKEDDSDDK